ncbi:MAG TPA: outer membrane protein assembly factor BamD [Bacteroidetes bacterium]|nr:outer membrane protein assembly factor BamD [Bacteroidota bacterium]
MSRLRAVVLVLVLGLGLAVQAEAQARIEYVPSAETQFQQAGQLFKSGQIDQAAQILNQLAAARPLHQRSSAALVLLAKAYYRLGRCQDAVQTAQTFLKTFPQSRYLPYARYILAACYAKQGRARDAVPLLAETVATTRDSALQRAAFRALVVLVSRLDRSTLHRVSRRIRDDRAASYLELAEVEVALQRGALSEVIRRGQDLAGSTDVKAVRKRAKELVSIARQLQRGNLRIGVILPLSGYYAEQGKSLLRGIEFALKRNKPEGLQLDLVVRDSESSLLRAIQAAQDMTVDDRIIGVIGELEGDKSIAIGAITSSHHLPLLVPASSLTGVASVGEYVFQMNADLERRGQALAEYAYNELGHRTYATLAPADEYGRQITDAFTERVDELGGSIVAQAWYYESAQDLSRQFKMIRKLGFLRFIADTLKAADSTLVVVPKEKVEAVWKALNDTLKANAKPGDPTNLVDDEDVPVLGIDAMFFPVYTEDIPYVASQYAFYNIRAHPLGGSYWYAPEELRKNKRYVDGLVFVSDWFLDETDPVFLKFRDDFRLLMHANPDRWAAYGYDAMNLLLKAIREGASTREELKDSLEQMEHVQGIRGETTFKGSHRVNSEVNILQFVGGKITRLK